MFPSCLGFLFLSAPNLVESWLQTLPVLTAPVRRCSTTKNLLFPRSFYAQSSACCWNFYILMFYVDQRFLSSPSSSLLSLPSPALQGRGTAGGEQLEGKTAGRGRRDMFLLSQPLCHRDFSPCTSLTQTHKLNHCPIQRSQPLARGHLFLPIANPHDFMADLTKIDVFLKGPVLWGEIWLPGGQISEVLLAAIQENPQTEQIWHEESSKPSKSGGSSSVKYTWPSAAPTMWNSSK